MAMNEPSRHGNPPDPPADQQLGRLYRESAREEPPAHLDATIVAAARRDVHAGPRSMGSRWLRSWRLPVSIAAVVAVSVSLVTLMLQEGEEQLIPPRRTPETAAQRVERESEPLPARPAEPTPPAVAAAASQMEGQSAPAAKRSDTAGTQEKPAAPPSKPGAEPVPAPGAIPESLPAATRAPTEQRAAGVQSTPQRNGRLERAPEVLRMPATGTEGGAIGAATVPSAPGEARRQSAPVTRSGLAAESAGAATPRPKLALQKSALVTQFENQRPDQWLEKIVELRREGRGAEADELLAEFKKRFPDHPLPAALR